MSEHRFKIVFNGALLPGVEITTAKLNLAHLFKSDVTAIERLFSGKSVALKRDLSRTDAQTYLDALSKTGIDARIEPELPIELSLAEVHQPASDIASSSSDTESPYSPPRAAVGETLPEFSELKVFSVQGRIGRLRFLAWTLVSLMAATIVAAVIVLSLFSDEHFVLGGLFGFVALLAYLYVNITITVQRLHDLGWSGWLWFLNLVPMVGSVFPILITVMPGNTGANRYGAPPPPNSSAVKILSALWLVLLAVLIIGALAGGLGTLTQEYQSSSMSSYEIVEPATETAEPAQPPVDSAQE
ncbi:DUF805 domain-containing protein [Pseudomonas fluorescens]|uniref:DUF805 domain-containing protein n=1 Tax=Pseudomonas fluorescens TaxID=294 RepID=A0A5E6ZNN5_PSEFL|nr:DUF805 domain-containing protein [Pseudomonas fluorescens]VVN68072.1 hypothetical protein PS691_00225 [Pseudomonas fluorescens]